MLLGAGSLERNIKSMLENNWTNSTKSEIACWKLLEVRSFSFICKSTWQFFPHTIQPQTSLDMSQEISTEAPLQTASSRQRFYGRQLEQASKSSYPTIWGFPKTGVPPVIILGFSNINQSFWVTPWLKPHMKLRKCLESKSDWRCLGRHRTTSTPHIRAHTSEVQSVATRLRLRLLQEQRIKFNRWVDLLNRCKHREQKNTFWIMPHLLDALVQNSNCL